MDENLGLGLGAGAAHYRAYVGPPEDYDLISAMSFSLLVALGLRQHHRLLDIGCGSLRLGRLFIPYLNRGNYAGVEPNGWLIKEGVAHEVGASQLAIKQPRFYETDAPQDLPPQGFDFAVAQSIFSHTGPDLLEQWLARAQHTLKPTGLLAATFLLADTDTTESGWVYPGCVCFTLETMAQIAARHGLRFRQLDWHHPRQSWGVFCMPDCDLSWLKDKPLGWNTCAQAHRAGLIA